jgi:hypothetical protein
MRRSLQSGWTSRSWGILRTVRRDGVRVCRRVHGLASLRATTHAPFRDEVQPNLSNFLALIESSRAASATGRSIASTLGPAGHSRPLATSAQLIARQLPPGGEQVTMMATGRGLNSIGANPPRDHAIASRLTQRGSSFSNSSLASRERKDRGAAPIADPRQSLRDRINLIIVFASRECQQLSD